MWVGESVRVAGAASQGGLGMHFWHALTFALSSPLSITTHRASVRGADVYVIQSGIGEVSANDAVMELLIIIVRTSAPQCVTPIWTIQYKPTTRSPLAHECMYLCARPACARRTPARRRRRSVSSPCCRTSRESAGAQTAPQPSLLHVSFTTLVTSTLADHMPIPGTTPTLPPPLAKHSYAKQSKMKKRSAIPAKLISAMLTKAGIEQIITIDLTPLQMVGFFDMPINNIQIQPLLVQWVREKVPDYQQCVIVAKNAGASKR